MSPRVYAVVPVSNWMIVLAVVYGIMVLITMGFATLLAYDRETPYRQMPQRYRNRRWVKPLLPILFIILPALLWPIVMVGMGIILVGAFLYEKHNGSLKRRKANNEKDVERGSWTDVDDRNGQPSPVQTPPVTTQPEQATTISKLPPAYTGYGRGRRMPEEEHTC